MYDEEQNNVDRGILIGVAQNARDTWYMIR